MDYAYVYNSDTEYESDDTWSDDDYDELPHNIKTMFLNGNRNDLKKSEWSAEKKSTNGIITSHKDLKNNMFVRNELGYNQTDAVRSLEGVNKGIHAWEICWPCEMRDWFSCLGIYVTKDIKERDYSEFEAEMIGTFFGEENRYGLDLIRNIFYGRNYEMHQFMSTSFECPSKIIIVVDLIKGELSYISRNKYMGVAIDDLKGSTVFIEASTTAACNIRLKYLCGYDYYEPQSLKSIAANATNIYNLDIDELPIQLQNYLYE